MTGSAIQREGFETVTVACELAIEERTISADALLNILSRLQTNPAPAVVATPEQLCLKLPPIADYGRYDALLSRSAEGCQKKTSTQAPSKDSKTQRQGRRLGRCSVPEQKTKGQL